MTAFRANPYRDLYQDVFQARTAEYELKLGYDDVEGAYDLRVKFIRPWGDREATMSFGSHADAIARVTRFLTEHPAPKPTVLVDY